MKYTTSLFDWFSSSRVNIQVDTRISLDKKKVYENL